MKFTIVKEKLYPVLQNAGNFTSKTLSTILQNLLIEASATSVTIKTTNFQTAFTCTLDANVLEPGATTVSAKKLSDIVKELPDGKDIDFIFDGSRLHVKSGRSSFQLSTMDADLFPKSSAITSEYSFTIEAEPLLSIFKKVSFCISNDTSKLEYNGAHINVFADKIEVSAADYQRIATTSITFSGFSDEFMVNIPKKTILDIIRIFEGVPSITIETDRRQILFKTDSMSVSSKLIEKYIKSITRLFSVEYKLNAKMNRQVLSEVVKRISAITSEITHGILFSFTGANLTVTSLETEHGKGMELIEGIEFDGETIDIIFNAKHLLEILSNITTDTVRFAMNSKAQPALILPESDDAKYLLVPISVEKLT